MLADGKNCFIMMIKSKVMLVSNIVLLTILIKLALPNIDIKRVTAYLLSALNMKKMISL